MKIFDMKGIFMKCSKCQTEFEGAVCPNCGAQAAQPQQPQQQYRQPVQYGSTVTEYKKKKKPVYKRAWFVILVIIAALAIIISVANAVGIGEKIVWSEMVMGELLPEPPNSKGDIHENSTERLWLNIIKVSESEYNTYLDECREKGFTIDEKAESSLFEAFNEAGNKLELQYSESSEELTIDLTAPMEFSDIAWPGGEAGGLLPVPKSLVGKIENESASGFTAYIANTTIADFNAYASACSEKGFDVDYTKNDGYYSAKNADGWSLTLEYRGFNTMSIYISAPDETENAPAPDESEPEEKAAPKQSNDSDSSSNIDPDFKAAVDSYEEFMNDYVDFMKKYKESDGSDLSLISDYADMMSKYSQYAEDFKELDDGSLTTAEAAYYMEVQSRVSQKLLEIA